MSAPKSIDPSVKVEKPRFNIYTMMLLLAFFAVTIACVLLFLELGTYSAEGSDRWWWDTSAVRTSFLQTARAVGWA